MARLRKGVDEMRIITTLFIFVCLYAAGATGYIIADNQPEPAQPDTFSDSTLYRELTESQDFEYLNRSLADFDVKYEYQRRTFDCREFSAVLDHHLKLRDFDCGLTVLRYDDKTAHRINWVRLDNITLFIEPQGCKIIAFDDLQDIYRKNIVTATLHGYNAEVLHDEVIVFEK